MMESKHGSSGALEWQWLVVVVPSPGAHNLRWRVAPQVVFRDEWYCWKHRSAAVGVAAGHSLPAHHLFPLLAGERGACLELGICSWPQPRCLTPLVETSNPKVRCSSREPRLFYSPCSMDPFSVHPSAGLFFLSPVDGFSLFFGRAARGGGPGPPLCNFFWQVLPIWNACSQQWVTCTTEKKTKNTPSME